MIELGQIWLEGAGHYQKETLKANVLMKYEQASINQTGIIL